MLKVVFGFPAASVMRKLSIVGAWLSSSLIVPTAWASAIAATGELVRFSRTVSSISSMASFAIGDFDILQSCHPDRTPTLWERSRCSRREPLQCRSPSSSQLSTVHSQQGAARW